MSTTPETSHNQGLLLNAADILPVICYLLLLITNFTHSGKERLTGRDIFLTSQDKGKKAVFPTYGLPDDESVIFDCSMSMWIFSNPHQKRNIDQTPESRRFFLVLQEAFSQLTDV